MISTRHLVDSELLPLLELWPQVTLDEALLPLARAPGRLPLGEIADSGQVEKRLLSAPGRDNAPDVPLTLYRPVDREGEALPCIYHIHGGGYVAGSATTLEPIHRLGEAFHSWEHERCPKRKGGKVFIAVGSRGDVAIHEGYVTLKEARKREAGETVEKPARPEISAAIQNYVDLHRHAAVRNAVASDSSIALRLAVAHMIHGSGLWHVKAEPQRAVSDAIAESVENCASDAAFDEKRRAVLAILGFDPETPHVTGGYDGEQGLAGLFAKLLALPDAAVRDVLAVVLAETLEAGSATIEVLGPLLGVDMGCVWQADDALLDMIRDREVLGLVLNEVAGEGVASANEAATGKVKRQIIRDCLTGENGRAKVEGWVPRWLVFPPAAYTERGGVATVAREAQVADLAIEQRHAEPVRIAA